jgi:hypothetical protein
MKWDARTPDARTVVERMEHGEHGEHTWEEVEDVKPGNPPWATHICSQCAVCDLLACEE